jgi:hypothetical protein
MFFWTFSMMKRYIVICRMNINNSKRFLNCFEHCTIKENHFYYDFEYWSTNVLNSNWILFLTNSAYSSMIMKFWCFFMWTTSFSHSQHRERKTKKIWFVNWKTSSTLHLRHARLKFIELLSRRANFAKTRHDLIDTEFLYE